METILTKSNKAKEVIKESIDMWKEKVAVFCSFGKDSMVVLHLALQVNPMIKVISIMTRFKPPETFDYLSNLKSKWNLNLTMFQSFEKTPDDLYLTDPDECCRIHKEEPTKRALKDLNAWICGLRRTEGRTRTDFKTIEKTNRSYLGEEGEIVKMNPILDWYEVDIWKYIAINNIPVHSWYARGYRSLGCAPCSHIIDDSDTERAGRWAGTSKCGGECGIHTMHRR